MFQFAYESDLCVLPRLSLWSVVIFDRELKSCIALRTIYYIWYPEVGIHTASKTPEGLCPNYQDEPTCFLCIKNS